MNTKDPQTSLEKGTELIKSLAKQLPETPGVYRMLNAAGDALYVGKAKSLKKRVSNYTLAARLTVRLQRMVAETSAMEFIHTHTEVEALLLEANMIKKQRPRYNILLKDDKAFAQIFMSGDHDYPLLRKHRGAKNAKGEYFGPFASGADINATINILQRVFKIRNCSDSYFAQRTRPCLQYHIKRCTAPCVGYVTKEAYGLQVKGAKDFLRGKSSDIQKDLAKLMELASEAMEYELAGEYRDRIKALTALQQNQNINVSALDDADVMGVVKREGKSCVQVFFFRGGQNFGSRAYFPAHDTNDTPQEILTSFIMQFYDGRDVPPEIIISHDVPERDLIQEALSTRENKKIIITAPQRGIRKQLTEFVLTNAEDALVRHLVARAGDALLLEGVANLFGLDESPKRIEVYDNSHISGTNQVGAMIVAGPEGLMKNAYRKFNIKTAAEADDYGMMREVISRRFKRALDENDTDENWPDLVLIDGGQGQLNAVMEIVRELGIADDLVIVGVAKGEDRNAGRERFFMEGKEPFQLPVDDAVLHYLQRLRDEAHRFAIGAHRSKRIKQIGESPLDDVPGIGAKRKKALLLHFGSAKAVAQAGLSDLEKVDGISREVALRIYNHFHDR